MILIIDNYDSFTWNLVDILRREVEISVYRNNEIDPVEIASLNPEGIIISPGPELHQRVEE